METNEPIKKEKKPLGFGKTMLASAVGFLIATMVINIITFISFIVFFISAISSLDSSNSEPIIGSDFAIELNLTGGVTERSDNELNSLFSKSESTSIQQLLLAIENAANDDRVTSLYLHLGGMGLGWAQAEELAEALQTFTKDCGKPIVAYGESMSQPEYYLATYANVVAMHPDGMLDFRGMGAEMMFYKGLLDKLGVHMELIRPTSCSYKSAGEVYTRTDMSDANREQVRSYISSIWNYAAAQMANNRKMNIDQINDIADNLTGYLPKQAKENGLIDTLCFFQDIKQMLKEQYGAKKIIAANRYAKEQEPKKNDTRIAIIYAEGNVVTGTGDGLQNNVYGDDIVKAFEEAAKDEKVKAIVLRVNSPGGAAIASESMTHAIIKAKEQKPVIVSMSGLAASAGYEISCMGTKIVAHPTTLTGSIGVFATLPEVGGLLRNRLGLTTDTVMTNKNSTGLSLYRPLSPSARAMLQNNVEDFYVKFVQRVADGRGMSWDQVNEIARGRVWTGLQAKEIGLVDTLGGLSLALHLAAEEAKVDFNDCSMVSYPEEKDFLQQLLDLKHHEDEIELRARLNQMIPFYDDIEAWSTMEPLQARLPFSLIID